GIGGGAHTRVHDDGYGDRLENDLDVVWVPDPEPRADRGAEGHDDGRAGVLELFGHHRVVVGVGHYREPFLRERLRRLEKPLDVGEKRARVADDLELDHLAEPRLARQIAGADRLVRRVAARRIR